MLETDKVFAGSIPENYDRYMVPLIFEPNLSVTETSTPQGKRQKCWTSWVKTV